MGRSQAARRALLILFSAAILAGHQTQNTFGQDSSQNGGKVGTIRPRGSLASSLRQRALRTGHHGGTSQFADHIAGVSYSATPVCIQTDQTQSSSEAPADNATMRIAQGRPLEADDAMGNINCVFVEKPEDASAPGVLNEMLIGPEGMGARTVDELVRLAPSPELTDVPQPDRVQTALAIVLGEDRKPTGGLWVSGDLTKAMEFLHWVAGDLENELFYISDGGRVELRSGLLALEAGAEGLTSRQAGPVIADYISSREGLLLLTELTQGGERYLLHIGSSAPTMGEDVKVSSTINLDRNFDSRINPRRPNGQKVAQEQP